MSLYHLDEAALYRYLNARRQREGLSWRGVAAQTGCPPSLFTKISKGGAPNAHALMTLLVWLGLGRDLSVLLAFDGGSANGDSEHP